MKHTLTLLLAAVLGLGAIPSSADAATVVVSTGPTYYGHRHYYGRPYHRRSRVVYHSAHWEWHHGHRIFYPATRTVVYY